METCFDARGCVFAAATGGDAGAQRCQVAVFLCLPLPGAASASSQASSLEVAADGSCLLRAREALILHATLASHNLAPAQLMSQRGGEIEHTYVCVGNSLKLVSYLQLQPVTRNQGSRHGAKLSSRRMSVQWNLQSRQGAGHPGLGCSRVTQRGCVRGYFQGLSVG